MRRLLPLILLLLIFPMGNVPALDSEVGGRGSETLAIYEAMGLDGELDYGAFERAVEGYARIDGHRGSLMTVIDFTKPSTAERLYVIDMERRELLLRSHVSHGQNSGGNYATSFSNENGSHKSSLGFYLTGETYTGRNGYSMRLHGLEDGINDRAYERAVVVHGAAYANPSNVSVGGRLGRSFGCPALPQALNAKVIDMIKDGTVLFIYAEDRTYLTQSTYIN